MKTASPVISRAAYIDRDRLEESLSRSERETAEALTLLDTLQSTAPVGFLFVDRNYRYVRVNEKMAAINGASVQEHIGRTVAEVVPKLWPQIEPIYRRVLDSGEVMLDYEMTGETSADPGHVHHWLVNFYPVRVDAEIIGIGVVVIDITERKEAEAALRTLTEAAVGAMAAAVEARDPYTAGHQRRVAGLSVAIAYELGLDPHDIQGIRLAANIHDIGKISTPSEILSKPGRLSASEFALVKEHAQAGYDIVRGIDFPWPVPEMILQHHERSDGSGYPSGLTGGEILIGAHIIGVADVIESMASHRPYRPALGIEAAMLEIQNNGGRLYDPTVAEACLRLHQDGRLGLDPVGHSSR